VRARRRETADAKLQALANQATQALVDLDRWHGDGIIAGCAWALAPGVELR